MGDDIVELTRDPEPLLLGSLLALLLMPLHDLEEELAPGPHVVADHPGHERERAGGNQDARGGEIAEHEQDHGDQDDRDRGRGHHQAHPRVVVDRDRVDGKRQADARGLAVGSNGHARNLDAHDEEKNRQGMAAPPPESSSLDQHRHEARRHNLPAERGSDQARDADQKDDGDNDAVGKPRPACDP